MNTGRTRNQNRHCIQGLHVGRFSILLLTALLLAGFSGIATAHLSSTAFIYPDADSSSSPAVTLRLDLPVDDLHLLMDLDTDSNRKLTWGEVEGAREPLLARLGQDIRLSRGGESCMTVDLRPAFTRYQQTAFVVLPLQFECPAPGALTLDYQLLFDLNPGHRALVLAPSRQAVRSVISQQTGQLQLVSGSQPAASVFRNFWMQGLTHILEGYDHLLFLVTLMLPVVLGMDPGRRGAEFHISRDLVNLFKLVTAFTLGHSVTLALVTLGVVAHPGDWIEPAIALSITLAAANNLVRFVPGSGWMIASALGLLHGFGFASVLQQLGVALTQILPALVAFNLGVEAGQLLVVMLILPLLLLVRALRFYPGRIMQAGSIGAGLLGIFWMLQSLRLLD